jgi:hypothetical protein
MYTALHSSVLSFTTSTSTSTHINIASQQSSCSSDSKHLAANLDRFWMMKRRGVRHETSRSHLRRRNMSTAIFITVACADNYFRLRITNCDFVIGMPQENFAGV